jgi:hypothetical protein
MKSVPESFTGIANIEKGNLVRLEAVGNFTTTAHAISIQTISNPSSSHIKLGTYQVTL